MIADSKVNEFYQKLKNIFATSGNIAYRYYEEQYSYQEMYEKMLRFNNVLSDHKNATVVLFAEKSFLTYSAIFSILLSGNTWVPLSTNLPVVRNKEIASQLHVDLVLHDGTLPIDLEEFFKKTAVDTLSYQDIPRKTDVEFKEGKFKKDEIAYIMFTSGSTGIPKGVPMTHENYINFVYNIMEILPFQKNEVFSDFHEFAFDISIFYLFTCPLCEGAFAPILDEKDKIIPINHIIKNEITVWSSVPSIINRIKTFRPKEKITTQIHIMFLCGEPMKLEILRYCYDNLMLQNVYNFYGLTETGVENFFHRCNPGDLDDFINYGVIPIGKSLPGNEVKVTDERELVIGGCQVTPGYLGGRHPEMFKVENGIRWFYTGDIVDIHDGLYFCKGRLDSQVKIAGLRVELMDIEAHLNKLNSIDESVCFLADKGERKLLIAAVKTNGNVDFNVVKAKLQKELPPHMIPADYVKMETFPLNNNGKTDRKRIQSDYDNKSH